MKELRFRPMDIQEDRYASHRYNFEATVEWIPRAQSTAVTEWCSEQFGEAGPRWFTPSAGYYRFRDQTDALVFKMRWA